MKHRRKEADRTACRSGKPNNREIREKDIKKEERSGSGRTHEIALGGILTVVALMFSYIESFLPAAPGLPGIKIGLANLVVLVLLYCTDWKLALSVNCLRILLSGLLFTGPAGALYSLGGGLLSFGIMLLFKKAKLFSVIGVSMAGGVFHNIGQLLVAAAVTETAGIFYYLPILILSGTVSGILIGIGAYILIRALPRHIFLY